MNFRVALKQVLEKVPRPVGRAIARVPYSWRFGRSFREARKECQRCLAMQSAQLRPIVATRVSAIARFAASKCQFYKSLYAASRLDMSSLERFEDIARIPIVTKSDLRAVSFDLRSVPQPGRMRVNTGGTTGRPLAFYLDRNAFAREWAHMHFIWSRLGYRQTDLKLTFRGKNLGSDSIRYNAVHNEYQVNAYCPFEARAAAVRAVAEREQIAFLHGYPSSIYEFVRACSERHPEVLDSLRRTLRGVLFGSEYPAPMYRDLVEERLGAPSISWYGHSEMAVLAYEIKPFLYVPFQSYGYCEAVSDGSGRYRLVGTSYENRASPFIRYDTGDLVRPTFENGLLKSFHIDEGRVGDFVEDIHGDRISLTALIFGRHHPIFDLARFIQVRQERPGKVVLLVVPSDDAVLSEKAVRAGFDLSNVAIEFSVQLQPEPIRSAAGKVPLLVQHEA